MVEATVDGVTELTEEESESIGGGTAVQVATFFAACFGAGFEFGFSRLGPRLFG